MELEFIVDKCLAKEAGQRYQSTDDLIIDIDSLRDKLKSGRSRISQSQVSGIPRTEPQVAQESATGSNRERAAWIAAAVLGAALVVTAGLHFSEPPQESPPLRRFAVTPAREVDVSRTRSGVAISPNGRYVAYATEGLDAGLWVQDLGLSEPRLLEGTARGRQPFWSPESTFIGYETEGELREISVEGGVSVRVCELPSPVFAGGAWSRDGDVIVFSSRDYDLFQVSAQGGAPELLMTRETAPGEPSDLLARPYFLPLEANRRVLLYAFGSRTVWKIVLKGLDSGEQRVIGPGTRPAYSPSGHLVYQASLDNYDIWALPFSLDTLRATGESFPVKEGGRDPTVALDRTLTYLDSTGGLFRRLIWRDRAGEKAGEIGPAAAVMRDPELSPDGRYVAVSQTDLSAGGSSIWVFGTGRESRQRLTFGDHTDLRPRWLPSETEIAFTSSLAGSYDVYRRRVDGTGQTELLWDGSARQVPFGWSRDGKYLLVTSLSESGEGSLDIAYLRRQEPGDGFEAQPFLATPSTEVVPTLSPDGRFLAYCSDASGRMEVYVRPFPAGDGQWQVSEQGGCQPRWSRNGRELYYVRNDVLLAVGVEDTTSFTTTPSTELFSDPMLALRIPTVPSTMWRPTADS